MFTTVRCVQNLPRYRQIIAIFARHGFDSMLEQMGVERALLAPVRLVRRGREQSQLTPAQHFRLTAARIIKKVMVDGFFHADPHPGNFFVMPGNVIGAMDFGMVGHLTDADPLNLVRLYIASVRMDATGVVNQLIRMGAAEARGVRVVRKRESDACGVGLSHLGITKRVRRLL
jgi:hypothetical protein